MKNIVLLIALVFQSCISMGQQFKILSNGDYSDSSFYHIEKIADNEFWICGEYGILKSMDTLGNISPIAFSSNGEHLLKMVNWKNYVFISGDNGSLYRYDKKNKTWLKKKFTDFENRCFYDFVITENGDIIVCGGTRAIAKGKKKIPHGFIAVADTGLGNIKKVWSSYRKFVFSVSSFYDGNFHAFVFNGLSSRVWKSNTGKKWKKGKKMKGLIHDAVCYENSLIICGAKNFHYKEDGLTGQIYPKRKWNIIPQSGCIWSLQPFKKQLLGISRSGSISLFNPLTEKWKPIPLPQAFSIYDVKVVSENKLLLVGHGKRIYLAEF